jgi:hypothetical protein
MTHEVIAAARIGVGSVAAKKITGRYPSIETNDVSTPKKLRATV